MDDPDLLLLIVFVFFLTAFFIIMIVLVLRQHMAIKRLLERQALKRGGTLERKHTFRLLRFQYHEFPVIVSVRQGSRYQPPETRVHLGLLKSIPATVSIYHASLASRIGKAFGSQDIQLGTEEFDNVYMVKSDDELFAQNLITLGVQNQLLEMKQQKPHVQVHVSSLDVYVNRIFNTDEQYDQLIDLTTTLADRLQQLVR
jgi:hypothetical protein